MKERAITIDADEVRATLEGRKTQLRVPVKLREFQASSTEGWDWDFRDRHGRWNSYTTKQLIESKHSPLGKPGDRLWVREVFALGARCTDPDPDDEDYWLPAYRADGDERPWLTSLDEYAAEAPPPWRSPVLMPRWASRLTLEITEVRLQRLQQITEDDAIAEGVRHWPDVPDPHPYGIGARWSMATPTSTRQCYGSARFAFASAWNRRHGKHCPWDDNQPVWVYTFRRVR